MQHPGPAQHVQEITHRLNTCKRECVFYQEHGKRFQRKHLETRKRVAQEEEDEEALNKICAIIQQEQQRDFWRKLNYVTGKKRTRSATSIQVEAQGGAILERSRTRRNKQYSPRFMRSGIRLQVKPQSATGNYSTSLDTQLTCQHQKLS
jgi:hypothetical protein